jgi:hypothetical protein
VTWGKIDRLANSDLGKQNFTYKWLSRNSADHPGGEDNQFVAPQTVLIGRNGIRYRTLHRARVTGDGKYCCEFLAIEEVGGRLTGLPPRQHALLTAIAWDTGSGPR